MQINIISKKEAFLPRFNRVGDIIRIHRANINQFRQHKVFIANIDYGSSWILFKGGSQEEEEQNVSESKKINEDYDMENLNDNSRNESFGVNNYFGINSNLP